VKAKPTCRSAIYAERARKAGYPNVARLFTAIAAAEKVHARNHYRNIGSKGAAQTVAGALFGTRDTAQALQAGIDGETFEVDEMYPAYLAVARSQAERGAQISFTWAWEAEKIHATLFQKAIQAVAEGTDVALGPVQVCEVCGYTVEGDVPPCCPICNASKDQFRGFT
jgi:rubrerythrin